MFGALLLTAVLTLVVYGGVGVIVRTLAHYNFLFVVVRVNMITFITNFKNKEMDLTSSVGVGNVMTIIHGVAGHRLDRSSSNKNDWLFVPDVERRGILYHLYGVEWIGFFRYPATTELRTSRDVPSGESPTLYDTARKTTKGHAVFFSGEHTIKVKDVETRGSLRLDVEATIVWKLVRPVFAVFSVADCIALTSQAIEEQINQELNPRMPEEYIGGTVDGTPTDPEGARKRLAQRITNHSPFTKKEYGIEIGSAVIGQIGVDEKTRAIIELQARTDRENEALISQARARAEATILDGEARGRALEATTMRVAENSNATRIEVAKALAGGSIHTIAGADLSLLINGGPSGGTIPPKKKVEGFTTTEPEPRSQD